MITVYLMLTLKLAIKNCNNINKYMKLTRNFKIQISTHLKSRYNAYRYNMHDQT